MAVHVKDIAIRDSDGSTVTGASIANVLRAVDGRAPLHALFGLGARTLQRAAAVG